jgi:hypothetical protein
MPPIKARVIARCLTGGISNTASTICGPMFFSVCTSDAFTRGRIGAAA